MQWAWGRGAEMDFGGPGREDAVAGRASHHSVDAVFILPLPAVRLGKVNLHSVAVLVHYPELLPALLAHGHGSRQRGARKQSQDRGICGGGEAVFSQNLGQTQPACEKYDSFVTI